MTTLRLTCALGATLVLAGVIAWLNWPGPTVLSPVQAASLSSSPSALHTLFQGVATCAGRSCHGSLEPVERHASWQMEYSLWAVRDPHARAYDVLLNEQSKAIARRLGLKGGKAHEAVQCLACHVNPTAAPTPDDTKVAEAVRRERFFGVSCEACHGNAARWFEAHLSKDWRAKSANAKSIEHGLTHLADSETLVRTCADCHVGAPARGALPARDVNHDLIAAGHPRLLFEASSYFANLPKHWKPKPRPEAPLWAVGQAVSAEAALELLRHRVEAKEAPWPEFAEYDCASCHHDLTEPSWRQRPSHRRSGAMTWGTWYLSLPRLLGDDGAGDAFAAVDRLTLIMERPAPSPSAVREVLAASVNEIKELRKQLLRWQDTPETANAAAHWLMAHPRIGQNRTWDTVEQLTLALEGLEGASSDFVGKAAVNALRRWRDQPQGLGWNPKAWRAGPPAGPTKK